MSHYVELDRQIREVLNATEVIAQVLLFGLLVQIRDLENRAYMIQGKVKNELKDDHPQGWDKKRIMDDLAEFTARCSAIQWLLAWLCGEKQEYDSTHV